MKIPVKNEDTTTRLALDMAGGNSDVQTIVGDDNGNIVVVVVVVVDVVVVVVVVDVVVDDSASDNMHVNW